MKKITEEMKIHEEWYEEAKKQTQETLPDFIKKLTTEYDHDYGTICHTIASSAIAAAWAVSNSPQGGITGFQAGAIMWEFIRHWNHNSNRVGLRLVDYDNLLYPQYEKDFQKSISPRIFKNLQEEAQKRLDNDRRHAVPKVISHWESIVAGKVPFGLTIKQE